MKASCHLFTFLAYLTVLISAYGDYGAYERVFYYYTYRIDAAGNGGVPKEWAVGCAKVIGTGGTICNFNQFIQYITKMEGGKMIPLPNVHGALDVLPPVHATANALQTAGLTGAYNMVRINDKLPELKVEHLFQKAINIVENRLMYNHFADTALRDTMRTGAFDSMRAIHELRLQQRSEYLLKAWPKDPKMAGITPAKSSHTISTGAQVEIYNQRQTIIDNPGKRDAIRDYIMRENDKDKTHANNVEKANEARNKLDPNHADAIQCG
jgi:hypothetical protein